MTQSSNPFSSFPPSCSRISLPFKALEYGATFYMKADSANPKVKLSDRQARDDRNSRCFRYYWLDPDAKVFIWDRRDPFAKRPTKGFAKTRRKEDQLGQFLGPSTRDTMQTDNTISYSNEAGYIVVLFKDLKIGAKFFARDELGRYTCRVKESEDLSRTEGNSMPVFVQNPEDEVFMSVSRYLLDDKIEGRVYRSEYTLRHLFMTPKLTEENAVPLSTLKLESELEKKNKQIDELLAKLNLARRGSGRTTRMLKKAFATMRQGKTVRVEAHTMDRVRELVRHAGAIFNLPYHLSRIIHISGGALSFECLSYQDLDASIIEERLRGKSSNSPTLFLDHYSVDEVFSAAIRQSKTTITVRELREKYPLLAQQQDSQWEVEP